MANSSKKPRVRVVNRSGNNINSRVGKVKKTFVAPIAKTLRSAGKFLMREYHPIKLPDNRIGRFLTKRRSPIPRFFRGAFFEIRHTTWPGARETARLTFAVFVFSIVFSIIVASLDFVLDKIFKTIILG